MYSSMITYAAIAIGVFAPVAWSASLQQVTDFGSNPSNLLMYIYVPDKVATSPAVIVALHGCSGSGPGYYQMTTYGTLADTLGFITIFPSAELTSEHCFDVATNATLTHNGGSDSLGITSMVKYTIEKYNADPKKVFATGTSSGAMMTNVLAGTYPDVFAAGSVYSGVACGCLAGSPGSGPTSADPTCADGKNIKTPEQWGAVVHNCYPGYNGTYPRMQLWHGTADTLVYYANLGEEIKEWSDVLGQTFVSNATNTPQTGYTKMTFGDGTKLVAYSAVGVGHTVPVHEDVDLEWFGIT